VKVTGSDCIWGLEGKVWRGMLGSLIGLEVVGRGGFVEMGKACGLEVLDMGDDG